MEHEASRQRLSAYLDGELSPAEREEVEGHVGACDACRKELESLRRASARLKEHGRIAAPAGLRRAMEERVQGRPRGPRAPAFAYVFATGAIVVLLLGAGKLLKPQLSAILNQVMEMISGAAASVSTTK